MQPAGPLSLAAMRRASAVASNVRYEDGVVCNAPGYETVQLQAAILDGLVARWALDETTGSRLDTSGNEHTLTEVTGLREGGITGVDSEIGKFGVAALFPAIPFSLTHDDRLTLDSGLGNRSFQSPLPIRHSDHLLHDVALSDRSFQNPRTEHLKDRFVVGVSLDTSDYRLATEIPNALFDKVVLGAALDSGEYFLVVVPLTAPGDEAAVDSSLDSGTYTQVVVPGSPVGTSQTVTAADCAALNAALDSGSYAEVVGGVLSVTDRILLTGALTSGSYG